MERLHMHNIRENFAENDLPTVSNQVIEIDSFSQEPPGQIATKSFFRILYNDDSVFHASQVLRTDVIITRYMHHYNLSTIL